MKKETYSYGGRGQKLSKTVQFRVSVFSQFVAVFDALHCENFLYHIIKYLTLNYSDLNSFFNGERNLEKCNLSVLLGGVGSETNFVCPHSACPIQAREEGGK